MRERIFPATRELTSCFCVRDTTQSRTYTYILYIYIHKVHTLKKKLPENRHVLALLYYALFLLVVFINNLVSLARKIPYEFVQKYPRCQSSLDVQLDCEIDGERQKTMMMMMIIIIIIMWRMVSRIVIVLSPPPRHFDLDEDNVSVTLFQ